MTKREAKEIAKDRVMSNLSIAYYTICDSDEYGESDKDLIIEYINKFGTTMAKSIKENYYTQ